MVGKERGRSVYKQEVFMQISVFLIFSGVKLPWTIWLTKQMNPGFWDTMQIFIEPIWMRSVLHMSQRRNLERIKTKKDSVPSLPAAWQCPLLIDHIMWFHEYPNLQIFKSVLAWGQYWSYYWLPSDRTGVQYLSSFKIKLFNVDINQVYTCLQQRTS